MIMERLVRDATPRSRCGALLFELESTNGESDNEVAKKGRRKEREDQTCLASVGPSGENVKIYV